MSEIESNNTQNSVLTAAEMVAIEQSAMKSGHVTGLELMERAGQGVVDAIHDTRPDLLRTRAAIMCGPGNNGGDGFVIARLLQQSGWSVEVFLLGNPDKLPADARSNHDRWSALGDVTPLTNAGFDGYVGAHPDTTVYVDALFGTGLARPLSGLDLVQQELNLAQAQPNSHVVAVDIPSGLSAETGVYLGFEQENPLDHCIVADLTVTFHRRKWGHMLRQGPYACGTLVVKDIGL